MDWISGISKAINYIEEHLSEELEVKDIAKEIGLSSFYFQKGFRMLSGFSVAEYIRQRRLTLAGNEVLSTDTRIIDIAIKYGYDSPDSFTKAFIRFHGRTPNSIRKEGGMIRSLAPLRIKFSLEGGFIMDYKIVEKEAFTIMGVSRKFKSETSYEEVPKFWEQHYKTEQCKVVAGMFGVCIDGERNTNEFEYFIADQYLPWQEVPEGLKTLTILKHTWAVFPCKGPMPTALQEVSTKIFSEWLPNCGDYEIAEECSIELYSDCKEYPKGNQDEAYYSEVWIPIKKKNK